MLKKSIKVKKIERLLFYLRMVEKIKQAPGYCCAEITKINSYIKLLLKGCLSYLVVSVPAIKRSNKKQPQ